MDCHSLLNRHRKYYRPSMPSPRKSTLTPVPNSNTPWSVLLSLICFLFAASPYAENDDLKKYFDIPAQTLSKALLEFSRQSDTTIVAPGNLVASKHTDPVRGHLTISNGLKILLTGTGLTFLESGDGGIVIRKKPVKKVARKSLRDRYSIEEILVEANRTREAKRQAIDIKKRSQSIMDVYNDGGIGSLPDLNIADSFRRLPGVVAINDSDEGRYVSVRGIDPNYNFVTVDYMATATDDPSKRSVNLEAIPATAMKRLEVYKSSSADMDANAIGGTLNMITRSAYDDDDMFLFIKSQLSHYTLDDVPDNDDGLGGYADATFSNTFGREKEWGMTLSGSYNLKRRDEKKTSNDIYDYDTPLGTPVNSRIRTLQYTNTWKRYGGSVKFEFRPSDTLYAYLNTFYFVQKEDESRHFESLEKQNGLTQYSPTTGLVDEATNTYRFTYRPTDRDNSGSHFHIDYYSNEHSKLSLSLAYSQASIYQPFHDVYYQTASAGELGYNYDMSNTYTSYAFNDPDYITNSDNYLFDRSFIDYNQNSDEILEYRIDYAVNVEPESVGWGYKFGTKTRKMTKIINTDRVDLQLIDNSTPSLGDFLFESNYTPAHYDHPIFIYDYDKFRAYLNERPSQFQYNSSDYSTTYNDWSFEENVFASYGMMVYNSKQFSFNIGLRYENSEHNSRGWSEFETRLTSTFSDGGSDYWLPSLGLQYNFSDSFRVRANLSETIGRAEPSKLSASETVSIDDDGTLHYVQGNSDLRPRESKNYDLSFEYYFDENDSLLSLTVFKKDIQNLIITKRTLEVIDGDFAWREYAENANSAYLDGIGVNWVKSAFSSLPKVFNGLGVAVNITRINAGTSVLNDEGDYIHIDHLEYQAELMGNVTLFFDYENLSMNLAYNYTGAYAEPTPSSVNIEGESWWEAYEQIDFSAAYQLSDKLSINMSVRNLNNEYRLRVVGKNNPLFSEDVTFGRSFWLGASYLY